MGNTYFCGEMLAIEEEQEEDQRKKWHVGLVLKQEVMKTHDKSPLINDETK